MGLAVVIRYILPERLLVPKAFVQASYRKFRFADKSAVSGGVVCLVRMNDRFTVPPTFDFRASVFGLPIKLRIGPYASSFKPISTPRGMDVSRFTQFGLVSSVVVGGGECAFVSWPLET